MDIKDYHGVFNMKNKINLKGWENLILKSSLGNFNKKQMKIKPI